MRVFQAKSLDSMMRKGLEHLLEHGQTVTSSRGASLEARGVGFDLENPRARVSRSAERGRFLDALGEFAWILSGSRDLEHIGHYIPPYANFVGEGTGAYGPRLFGPAGQISRMIALLQEKPRSRQAVAQLFRFEDLDGDPRDVPCTCSLQFFVRDERLELHVHMRSNDIMRGLPLDVFVFTMIQELVARDLGKEVGLYTHFVGSLHLYDNMRGAADKYLEEGHLANHPMAPMPVESTTQGVTEFLRSEEHLRTGSTTDALPEHVFWRDLVLMLGALRASRDGDVAALASAREHVSDLTYDIYLNELEWRTRQNANS